MDFTDCHFTYAGTSSREYGIKFVNCDTSRNLTINGEIEPIVVFNKKSKNNYLIGNDYSDSAVSFDAEVMTDSEEPLRTGEIRAIERWLFNRADYSKLYIDTADDCDGDSYTIIDGETVKYYLNCRFVNPSRLEGNGGVVGFKFTIETDSAFATREATVTSYDITPDSDGSALFTIDIDSDMNDYIYPKVQLTMGSTGGDLDILNLTDSNTRYTSFTALGENAVVTMNSETNYISGEYYTLFKNRNFIRLLPGSNSIATVGDVSNIKITYSSRKYL